MAPSQLFPKDARDAPELLVLATLETNLWTLYLALTAAFPELIHELARQRDGPALRAARRLADRAAHLERAISSYRRALQLERLPPDYGDLPF